MSQTTVTPRYRVFPRESEGPFYVLDGARGGGLVIETHRTLIAADSACAWWNERAVRSKSQMEREAGLVERAERPQDFRS